jgi:hypothetical protein
MRYAAEDAQFSIKEIDIGMAADVGTLQRLPRIIGDGMLRELAYTGRTFGAEEARAWAWSIAFTATRPACLMASWALPARSPQVADCRHRHQGNDQLHARPPHR